jgi:ketosteroid isomerase-like protein
VSPDNSNPPGRAPEDRLAEHSAEHSAGHSNEKRTDLAGLSGRSAERTNGERTNTDQVVASAEVEDFFQRLPGNFRWPKPNAEAVAAAVEAIQRMSGTVAAENLAAAAVSADDAGAVTVTCSGCGGSLPAGARFCVWCGIPSASDLVTAAAPPRAAAGQHHVHHHYHHFVDGRGTSTGTPATESEPSGARGRAPGSVGTSTGGRAEAGARQVVQDWAQACNTKHIDDLLELYAADATLIRSSVPPVRSLPAIREFLVSLLEAGLGDVEMESLRVEMMGDIALDLGRCKMLVPVAMGKRREERGKYLVIMVRQPAGTWKILADCWSSDMPVSPPPAPDPAGRRGGDPSPPIRKTR